MEHSNMLECPSVASAMRRTKVMLALTREIKL